MLFWGATSFDEVAPGYMGVRETFGERVGEPLDSGFYLKLPWPIQKIRKFPVDRIQEIFIGPEMHDKDESSDKKTDVLLWTVSHYGKENPFLIATEKKNSNLPDKGENDSKEKETVSVAILSALVPVQFKIKPEKLLDYGYEHKDPVQTLKYISEKEVAAYFANADMMKVMSDGRGEAISEIYKNIQMAADSTNLGVEIIAVTLLDAHPPILKGEEESTGLPQAFQVCYRGQREKRNNDSYS